MYISVIIIMNLQYMYDKNQNYKCKLLLLVTYSNQPSTSVIPAAWKPLQTMSG